MSGSTQARSSSSNPFANGAFDLAALTTLIGSSTAEQLALGNRGAAGETRMIDTSLIRLSCCERPCLGGHERVWLNLGFKSMRGSSNTKLAPAKPCCAQFKTGCRDRPQHEPVIGELGPSQSTQKEHGRDARRNTGEETCRE